MDDLQTLKSELAAIRRELAAHRRTNPNRSAEHARDSVDLTDLASVFPATLAALLTLLEEVSSPAFGYGTPEWDAYSAKDQEIVNRYNATVDRHNAVLQGRRNARETAKVYESMCNSCFTVHRTDVECF